MTTNKPVTMNPFMEAILQQLMTYVLSHVEEVIAMLTKFIVGRLTPEMETAQKAFRATPSEATLNALIDSLAKGGADKGQLAATLVNKVNLPLPVKGAQK